MMGPFYREFASGSEADSGWGQSGIGLASLVLFRGIKASRGFRQRFQRGGGVRFLGVHGEGELQERAPFGVDLSEGGLEGGEAARLLL